MPELIAKILKREFGLAELTLQFFRRFAIHGLLGALNQRQDVAHAEDARNNSLRIESFQRIIFFAEPDELYGCAGNFGNAQRRAAARVAVELGKNHSCKA